jgi:hypothetical protein
MGYKAYERDLITLAHLTIGLCDCPASQAKTTRLAYSKIIYVSHVRRWVCFYTV